MKNENKKRNTGFTIIETMISVSLFIVIVMAGMGALLNANLLHQKSQDMRSIMDNLSFVMDDMSRNLRTGYNYRCITSESDLSSYNIIATAQSGQNCWGIAFENQNGTPYEYDPVTRLLLDRHGEDQWVYEIVSELRGSVTIHYIRKSTDSGATWVQLTPDEVYIDGISGFSVLGAEPPSQGNKQQPFVTIKLVGTITYKNIITPFSLQTSVSQRALDNI